MTALHLPSTDETSPSTAAVADGDSQPGVREDLLSYASLGGFTLTAETHAWYAAVDTIGSPEDARAASTVLAELRGRDLPAARAAAVRLLAETTLGEPDSVATVTRAVALLLRVRTTLATLTPAVYEAEDLDGLVAATESGKSRKARGVKLSWGRRLTLGSAARGLAASKRIRRAALHAALASAARERADWAALAPSGAGPALPADDTILDDAAQAIDAAASGLRELGRLLPERNPAALPFEELVDLLDRLAADEGTLYRLPTLRTLRTGLEEQGFEGLLKELTARQADSEAVADTCDRLFPDETDVRQALVPEPRDGVAAGAAGAATVVEVEVAPAAEVEIEAEPEVAVEAEVEAEASAEVAVAVAVAVAAETEVEVEVEAEPEVVADVSIKAEAEAEPIADVEVEPEAEAEIVADVSVEAEPEAEPIAEVEAKPVADVVVEPAVEAEAEVIAHVSVEAEAEAEPIANVEVEAEPEVEAEAEVIVDVQGEVKVEPAVEAEAEVIADVAVEAEPEAEAEAVVEAQAEVVTAPDAVAEEAAEPAVAPQAGRPRKPSFTPGRPVTAYSPQELVSVVRWIDGDGVARTEDELLRAAMKEFGFARLGPRIKESLGAAVAEVRG